MLRMRLPSCLLPPRAILLAHDVVLLILPEGARLLSGDQHPFGTVSLATSTEPLKVAALRSAAAARGDEPSDILVANTTSSDPLAPILVGSDVCELIDDIDVASQRRLLSFLLGFCRKAFELGADSDFAANCLRLAQRCLTEVGAVEPIAVLGGAWLVLDGLASFARGSFYQLGPQCVRRIRVLPLTSQDRHVADRVGSGDWIVALGDHPGLWTVSSPTRPCTDLLTVRGEHRLRDEAVASLVEASEDFRARLREAAFLHPAEPIRHDDRRRPLGAGLDFALADGQGALFLRGWLRDPTDLVVAAEICGPTGARPLNPAVWHRFRRPDLDKHFAASPFRTGEQKLGFLALVEDPCALLPHQPTLRLQLRSGATVAVRAPLHQPDPASARAAILSAVPTTEVSDAMFVECISPAAAAFHRKLLVGRERPDCVEIGTPVKHSAVSVIVPLYRNLSFLRFQLAAFARDPECSNVDLIYVLDSPEQYAEAEHLLRGLHTLHGVPMRLVIMRRNIGYAAANNSGAAFARASKLLLLNSDVVPARPGWLGRLLAALEQPDVGAVGPKLLFDDGSIQHAGLLFQRGADGFWHNRHYYKGMPSAWPAANRSRFVPGVTGAALLLHRHRFEQIGGICEDYIIGDYEDSDLCLRLRSLGLEIHYAANAELFHFERRSIVQHKGYQGTLACRHNRQLHHGRWQDAIDPLMARFATPHLSVAA